VGAEALRPPSLDSVEWERGWCGDGAPLCGSSEERERDGSGASVRWFKIKEGGREGGMGRMMRLGGS
jgi:hypothetical protein